MLVDRGGMDRCMPKLRKRVYLLGPERYMPLDHVRYLMFDKKRNLFTFKSSLRLHEEKENKIGNNVLE